MHEYRETIERKMLRTEHNALKLQNLNSIEKTTCNKTIQMTQDFKKSKVGNF